MSRKIAAALVAAAAISLSACSNGTSQGGESFKGSDSDRAEIVNNAFKTNKKTPFLTRDTKVTGEVKVNVDMPGTSNDIVIDGKPTFEYDVDNKDASASFNGKISIPTQGLTDQKIDLKGYADREGNSYNLYGSINEMWVKTQIPSTEIDSALDRIKNPNLSLLSASSTLNPSSFVNDYADVKILEKGDDYVISAKPKQKVIDEFISTLKAKSVTIDKSSIKASAEIGVNKKSYALTSVRVEVKGKTSDNSASVDCNLKFDIDYKADVSIKVPNAAKNAKSVDLNDIAGSSGSGSGSSSPTLFESQNGS